ncbi:MAG: PSD1 domain-containing protein [Verrucomicrobia bacterium]|nr:PSD1 domain-containing protein [Verrucomicrobiota bacterium]
MNRLLSIRLAVGTFLFLEALVPCISESAETRPTPEQTEFFEKHIRPVLVETCYKCHSTESGKSKGSLLLDTKDATLKGGDTGPAVVPGDLDKSLLIKAVRYTDSELKMPPAKDGGKLPPEKIADLEAWVKMGAPDPRTGPAVAKAGMNIEKAREHWAFKPVAKPAVPAVKDKSWVKNPVDAFVLAKLEAKGMKPSEPADKRTLLRRVCYDLTGLPPTPQEMDDFLKDKSPSAYEKVVNRLLDSPHYGERWGRYWLDVARYADTKGYLAGGEERRFAFSHTFRDYVIKAFNDDKPYDRFLIEQLAADQLPLGEDKSALAGMGFLTLGRRFLNNTHDIIDDRIDVVMRGTMAMTVGCARCHDHKFDPIPTKDYYSLYGVFASSEEPEEKPLLGKVVENADYKDYLKQKADLEEKEEAEIADEVNKFRAKIRAATGDYLLAARDAAKLGKGDRLDTLAGQRKLTTSVLQRWIPFLDGKAKTHDPVLAPWFAFAALPENDFAKAAKELAAKISANADAEKPLNPAVAKAFAGAAPASLKDVAAIYNKLVTEVDKAWTDSQKASKLPVLPDKNQEAVRQLVYAAKAPASLGDDEVDRLLRKRLKLDTVKYRKQIDALNWTHPGAPARGMVLTDRPKPFDSRVFIRGNQGNPGPVAPRQFLEVLAGPERKPFKQGSGRLELAQAIASRDNPLTARVFVNRVWGWHFGKPFVNTPSDFGVRTEVPVQLDLLNWLAANFTEQGWSLKKLHRLIVLSSTYQQASDVKARYATLDPENNLLHRFNRRRLDFEAMRDTLLTASGKLDPALGGLPVDITKEPFSGRRTVYGFIDRQNLPAMFRTFDFANPDASSPQRFSTTVPQQALFMMNSPFVVGQAREIVNRPEVKSRAGDAEKIQALYQLLLQRAPDGDEVKMANTFLQKQAELQPRQAITPGWQYGYGWFDPLVNRTKDFHAITNLVGKAMVPGAKYPDAKFGHVSVTATGGHPGGTPQLGAVRRWVSPTDGFIRIEATLAHGNKVGDGVRGRIVSGRGGKLGEWTVFNNKVKTDVPKLEVKLGETVDFVVDCVGNSNSDSFTWAPKISLVGDYDTSLSKREWDAEKEFNAKERKAAVPLTAWEKLAQVLLLSNELMFVD